MKIVAVSGGGSGTGKTTVVLALLRALPGWGVLKTSPHEVPGGYELVFEITRLASPGTDTLSYLRAGASPVGWLIGRPPLPPEAVTAVDARFARAPGLLVEGGSLAEGLAPGFRLLVVRAGGAPIKDSALEVVGTADAVVVNTPAGTGATELDRTLSRLREAGARRLIVADPAHPHDAAMAALAEEIATWARC